MTWDVAWVVLLGVAMVVAAGALPVALYRLAEDRVMRSRMAMVGVRSHRHPIDRAPDWPVANDLIRCPSCGQLATQWMFWSEPDEEP